MKKLNYKNVNELFLSLLFTDGEDRTNYVLGEGAMLKCGFHPMRLNEFENDIADMLLQLPDEFMQSKGGGMSFLNACMDKDGEQWGEHNTIDQLLAMGIASKKASFLMPREMWSMLPGGMPYFVVKDI
jgi:hypothetical protein